MRLNELKPGEFGRVTKVGGEGALRQHFLDMGVTPGTVLEMIKLAPMGDPMELRLHGYELTLRLADAEQIEIEAADAPVWKTACGVYKDIEHPGLGEYGKSHERKTEHPLPDSETLTFALAGNQNSGKTTLFNQLTGANQHVGNFPGVTVDRKDGVIKGHPQTLITDLPGIYSLSPYTSEEIVSREFILEEKPKGVINILDATSIERGLYLTMQLMELNVPMVLALNMMDEMRGNGGSVDINRMESLLGIPVVPISASKGEGIEELVDHALHVAKYQEPPARNDFCSEDENGGAVHRAIHGIVHLIDDHAAAAGVPARFAATKIIEGDNALMDRLGLTQNEKETIEHIILTMEEERGLDRAAAIADMRFGFIQNLVAQSVVKPRESKERERSERIDRILTGKWTAFPGFIAIMGVVFYLTFFLIGPYLQDLLDAGITRIADSVDQWMTAAGVS
ncbi:MAG: 50S ribosome-binding GTPase, partial [Firmicutes bacterium]|nr:50S ribosome-binding GTPase [Bacillota bacterium]